MSTNIVFVSFVSMTVSISVMNYASILAFIMGMPQYAFYCAIAVVSMIFGIVSPHIITMVRFKKPRCVRARAQDHVTQPQMPLPPWMPHLMSQMMPQMPYQMQSQMMPQMGYQMWYQMMSQMMSPMMPPMMPQMPLQMVRPIVPQMLYPVYPIPRPTGILWWYKIVPCQPKEKTD